MPTFLEKLLGADPSAKFLKRHAKTIAAINALESELQPLADDVLRERAERLRKEIEALFSGAELEQEDDPFAEVETSEKLVNIHDRAKVRAKVNHLMQPYLVESFALTREAARRTVGERHFDVQLLGGIALHEGAIAEMRTGEGKTLVATLPLVLNAFAGKGAHLITVNDYLAQVGVTKYAPVYAMLGLTVGVIGHDRSLRFEDGELVSVTRQEAYACDITYGTNNEYGFDYLRDNMASRAADIRQREQHFAIVDEVDSILIDEARTPLIISGAAEESADLYQRFAQLVPKLKQGEDFTVDEKDKAVSITNSGITKMERWLGGEAIYGENVLLAYHLEEALKAHILYLRDRHYVVQEGEVVIVDEFTGRLMPGRRYSEGLHQAIEAKEGVVVQRESTTLATITFQNLFRSYVKLSGMTGTAATEAEEFHKIYGLDVVTIPTHRPMVRVDKPDRIYGKEAAKYKAIVEEIRAIHESGRPVLVGTISVEKNETLSKALLKAGLKHEVLNAKNHLREAEIIAEAGKRGAITLATNMAGRGTDIMLGGPKPSRGDFESDEAFTKAQKVWEEEHDTIVSLGGLHVIGTERHESRRIDNQLRGRAGRQGDPGSSVFFVSTEDDLMRIFGGDRIQSLLATFKLPEDEAIEHKMLSKSLETAQKRVEGHNFDIRKRLIQYDDVLSRQREVIYGRRRRVLLAAEDDASEIEEVITRTLDDEVRGLVGRYAAGSHEEWQLDRLTAELVGIVGAPESQRIKLHDELAAFTGDAAVEDAARAYMQAQVAKQREKMGNLYPLVLRSLYMQTIDKLWTEHLTVMQELRTGVGLRGYAQTDPLIVYTQEGFRLFKSLLATIDHQATHTVLRIESVDSKPIPEPAVSQAKIG
jgi:preprotein translocase subunit SecA